MKTGVYHSQDIDSEDAIREILEAAGSEWSDRPPNAGVVYAGIDHDLEVINGALLDRWPELEVIGCSTDGELSSVFGKSEDSAIVVLFGSDRVHMRAGAGRNVAHDAAGAADAAVRQALGGLDPSDVKLCVALIEGVRVDGALVVEHIQAGLPEGVPIVGGMAGDQTRFTGSKQAFGREELTDSVCVLLFAGPLEVSTSVGHGWSPVGEIHRVTRAEGHLVSEIDGQAAGKLFDTYFGGHSIHFPLAVYPEDDGEFYLAASPEKLEDGSLVVFNAVPQGAKIRLADAAPDEVIAAVDAVAEQALEGFSGTVPEGCLVFSCAGRRALLGSRVREEIELLRRRLPPDVPFAGFYTYGEICSLRGQQTARTHNSTMVLALLTEERPPLP